MGFLKTSLLLLLSFLLIFSLFISILLFSLNPLLFPETYKNAFEKNKVYDSFEDIFKKFVGGSNRTNNPQLVSIKEGELKKKLNEFIDSFFSYINSQSSSLILEIPINNSALNSFFEQEAEKIPLCKPGENPFISENVTCRFSNMTSREFMFYAFEKKNITISGMPAKLFLKQNAINLADDLNKNKSIDKIRDIVKIAKIIFLALSFLSLLLAIIIILLKRKELKSGFRWLAFVFLVACLLLSLAFITPKIAIKLLSSNEKLSYFNIDKIIPDLLVSFSSRIIFFVLFLFALFIILLAASFFIQKK